MTFVEASLAHAERAAADDPCTRLHQYQQQLRAELLAAASAEAARPSWWQRAWTSAMCADRAVGAALAIGERVRALTEAGATYAHRQVVALAPATAEA